MPKKDIFTIIMDTYHRPHLLKQALEALFRQTYDNLEIILINNGATPETIDYLHEVEVKDKRVKLIHFAENQFSWDDPHKIIHVCHNAGLQAAHGDYIWYQADDDMISDDYAEKMVALFRGNSECITAAGITVSLDIHGNANENAIRHRKSNFRPRYMHGHELAFEYLRGNNKIFSAPGAIFTIKREVLIKAGGYHRAIESSHLYGIVPFGITGFDETAIFYWRRHDGQLNKQLTGKGFLGIDYVNSLLDDWKIEDRWRQFGPEVAREVVSTLKKECYAEAAGKFVPALSLLRINAILNISRRMGRNRLFWTAVFAAVAKRPWCLLHPMNPVLKPFIRFLFLVWPDLSNKSPNLERLRGRVSNKQTD